MFRGTPYCVIVVGGRTFAELWGNLCLLKNSLLFDRDEISSIEFEDLNRRAIPLFQAISTTVQGQGPCVCRLCSWCLAVVYVDLFNNRQVRRRHHRLATCTSEGSRSSASTGSREDPHLLKSSSVVRNPLILLYYFLGVKTRWC